MRPTSFPAGGGRAARGAKVATVLFADLVGSTQLAGGQDPERTRALLNRFYDAMAAEISSAGGTVEKFVGDAVMAAFGAPLSLEDHAERALHAALSMRLRLDELFGDALSLRIGVNTGEVVVGPAREGSSFVSGDAVNVAARLEQAAGPGEILVGERTASAVRGAFELEEPTRVEAKGKEGGVVCRRLVRALSLMRPRGVGGLRQAFVGREQEVDVLRASYARARATDEPQLVTILGEAGIGKTTLVRELWGWLGSQSPEPLRRTGRCLSYGQGITYVPVGEIVREHLGLVEGGPADVIRRRLGRHEMLGLALGLEAPEDLHPLAARDRLRQAWVSFLEELVSERPAVVLVEDLHWAEEPLLDLLEAAFHDVRGPLLMLATARPEFLQARPGWGVRGGRSQTLWLEALSTTDAERMVEQLVPATLPESIREVVIARAEGNPFFVEEVVRTLIDQGVLRRNGGWTVSELPPDLAVPDTVQAVLAARIDLLAPAEKAALQAAAVIGRTFWSGPVYELVGSSAARSAPARGARLHTAPSELVDQRRAGVRDQARADARGRVRKLAEGKAGAPARAVREVVGAYGRGTTRRAGSHACAPLRRRRGSRRGRPGVDGCRGRARARSRAGGRSGSGAPPSSPLAATRSRTPSRSSNGRRRSSPIAQRR